MTAFKIYAGLIRNVLKEICDSLERRLISWWGRCRAGLFGRG
jgi:hypothetical protein